MPTLPEKYALLDTGEGTKLEQVGPVRIVRPCPQAIWLHTLGNKQWRNARAVYVRTTGGTGEWRAPTPLPKEWEITWEERPWIVRPTGFGHLGLFPEQAGNWQWLTRQCARREGRCETLNLFAYTGGSTLTMALAGAHVTHVDAARGVVNWGQANAALQRVPKEQVRWIVDDVMKFCARERRRQHRYHGIVLDPPSFGRGPNRELWKIEADLAELLKLCGELLASDGGPAFVLVSAHTPGLTPKSLQRLLAGALRNDGNTTCGEMLIPESVPDRSLPAGAYARWER